MNNPLFKIRCSQLSKIMSEGRELSPKVEYARLKKELEDIEENAILKTNDVSESILRITDKLNDKKKKISARLKELEPDKDKYILGKTCISYLDQWVKEQYYGRRRTLTVDQVQKGREVEIEAILLLNRVTGQKYKQDGAFLENDFMTGHRDIIDTQNKVIRDIKNCFTIDTYHFIGERALEGEYEWQMQGYFILTGLDYKKGYVDRVLINTPAWILEKEIYYIFSNLRKAYPSDSQLDYVEQQTDTLARELFLRHVYDQKISVNANGTILKLEPHEVIPDSKRVQSSEVIRRDVEKQIEERVLECRKYLKQNGY